jgi:hypothetical protein
VQCTFLPASPDGDTASSDNRDNSARYFLTEYGKLALYWLVLLFEGFGRQEAK